MRLPMFCGILKEDRDSRLDIADEPTNALVLRLNEKRKAWQHILMTSGSAVFIATPLIIEKSVLSI